MPIDEYFADLGSGGPNVNILGQDAMQEGVITQRRTAVFEMDDAELIEVADEWINEAQGMHGEFWKKQVRNERYYVGRQLDHARMGRYQSRIVLNKVWQSLETVVPRATKRLPAPMVNLPAEDDTAKDMENRIYSNHLEDVLVALANQLDMPQLLKDFLRFHQLFYLGVMKFGYDEETGVWIKNIRPQRILVPPREVVDEIDYVIEFHEDTLKVLREKFPGKTEEINEAIGRVNDKLIFEGTRLGYYEITTPEFKYWKINNVVLDKIENPHYDFDDVKRNHWKKPMFDYVFSDLWTLGISPYSQTTLVDQIITLQNSINKRKRQISDNADHANGMLLGYKDAGITKKDIAAIESARARPNAAVMTEGAPGSVQQFTGQSLQAYVFDDMLQTINEVDNIFGTHSTTRGEKTPGEETFGGRQLLKESDQERIEELTQMLERVSEKLYNAFAQMIRVHYKKPEYVSYLGEDGTSVQMKLDKKLIKDGVAIRVRQGSTLVKDRAALSAEAIQLWDRRAIDPITLYERLGDPSPFRTAERLFLWLQAPQELFKRVSTDLERVTKSDEAEKVLQAVAQAEIENRAILKGEQVPPFDGANPQHIAVHQDLFVTERFQQLPPEIRNAAADHLEAELAMVKGQTEERKKRQLQDKETNITEIIGQSENIIR